MTYIKTIMGILENWILVGLHVAKVWGVFQKAGNV